MNESKTILCVEDDEDSLELLQFILEIEKFRVVPCSTSEEGLVQAGRKEFSAIILDHYLADISGLEVCRRIRAYDQQTPIVFYSGAAYPKDREQALAAGANDYLIKPLDLEIIPETIHRLTKQRIDHEL